MCNIYLICTTCSIINRQKHSVSVREYFLRCQSYPLADSFLPNAHHNQLAVHLNLEGVLTGEEKRFARPCSILVDNPIEKALSCDSLAVCLTPYCSSHIHGKYHIPALYTHSCVQELACAVQRQPPISA